MQAIMTIEKTPAIFYKLPKKQQGGGCLWDYAATTVIHTEAGGIQGDYHLQPLHLNAADTVFMNKIGICFATGVSEETCRNILAQNL